MLKHAAPVAVATDITPAIPNIADASNACGIASSFANDFVCLSLNTTNGDGTNFIFSCHKYTFSPHNHNANVIKLGALKYTEISLDWSISNSSKFTNNTPRLKTNHIVNSTLNVFGTFNWSPFSNLKSPNSTPEWTCGIDGYDVDGLNPSFKPIFSIPPIVGIICCAPLRIYTAKQSLSLALFRASSSSSVVRLNGLS